MDNLSKLGKKYGTDKIGKHNYLPVYYEMFKDRRKDIWKVIEIGIAEGASLFMWRDFFPNAWVYGADNDKARVDAVRSYRMTTLLCDQTSPDDLRALLEVTGGDIDLVVDDGSHDPADQVFTCLTVMPLLKKGAVYVIEDVADPGIAKTILKELEVEPRWVNIKECGKRYDDRLVIVGNKNG